MSLLKGLFDQISTVFYKHFAANGAPNLSRCSLLKHSTRIPGQQKLSPAAV